MRCRSRSIRLQVTPLAACSAMLFGLVSPAAIANIVPVTNCADSGPGSLRAAVAVAADYDTVEMSALACSVITLTTGEILVGQPHLTLHGPGADKLRIDGNSAHRVLNAQGQYLTIQNLSIAHGYTYSNNGAAAGGCILAANRVAVSNTNIYGCVSQTYSGVAQGGGIDGHSVIMAYSTVSASTARCYSGGAAKGGGIRAAYLASQYATIDGNAAYCRPGGTAIAGGLYVSGGLVMKSTISNNTSNGNVGGILVPSAPLLSMQLRSSTVSGNSASGFYGGMVSNQDSTKVYQSTIAFNSAGSGSPSPGVYRAPGLHVSGANVLAQETVIANNTYGPAATENDFSSPGATWSAATASNLIRVATAPLPAGTITGVCPLLGVLRNNGGITQTHALLSHSAAIDAGGHVQESAYDQRGSPFVRISGAAHDIGAYEQQQADIVFSAAFDGCP